MSVLLSPIPLPDLPAAAALGALALCGAFVLLRARRVGLALHRQIAETREHVQRLEDALAVQQRLHERTHRALDGLPALREEVRAGIAAVSSALREEAAAAVPRDERLRRELEELASRHESTAREAAGLYAAIDGIAETIARRPAHAHPGDVRALESLDDDRLLSFAASLATLRPLVRYPRWMCDAGWDNPDPVFQLRRWFWQRFSGPGCERAIVVAWHGGTRLRLFLGNDLSAQIYIAGCIDPNEFALLDRILAPGMTFVDAGAGEGAYTVFAAARVGAGGCVWAFEPGPREIGRLRANLELNGLPARVFPFALADTRGTARLTVAAAGRSGCNTLGAIANPAIQVEGSVEVELRTLNEVVAEAPPARLDVLRVDVEGAELRLLRGARATLRRYRPAVLLAVSDVAMRGHGGSAGPLAALLAEERYRVYAFDRAGGLPVPVESGALSGSLLALPEERPLPLEAAWPVPLQG
jgi:FkbM family methyltransferase